MDEIKKVVEIDVQPTITSLKELKTHINELRDKLVTLKSGTQEYEDTVTQLSTAETKLYEVMKAGKQEATAAEGSYNHLAKTMAELKKQWKATTDEVTRVKLGEEIKTINDQLKELDASTGNFQRNVGDYANASSLAMKETIKSLKQTNGPLGSLVDFVTKLKTGFDQAGEAGASGFAKVRMAMSALGIGLLISGVTLLIKYWRELLAAFGIGEEQIEQFKQKALELVDTLISGFVGAGNVVLNFGKSVVNVFKEIGTAVKKLITGDFKSFAEAITQAKDNIAREFSKGIDFSGAYEKGKEAGSQFAQRLIGAFSKTTDDEAKPAATKAAEKMVDEFQQAYDRKIKELDLENKTITYKIKVEEENDQLKLDQQAIDYIQKKIELQKQWNEQYKGDIDKQIEGQTKLMDLQIQLATAQDKLKNDQLAGDQALIQSATDRVNYITEQERLSIEQRKEQRLLDLEEQELDDEERRILKLDIEREFEDEIYELNQQAISDLIALKQEEVDSYIDGTDKKMKAETELAKLRDQYAKNEQNQSKTERKRVKDDADYKKKIEELTGKSIIQYTQSMLGSVADMMDEGSDEYKATKIAETTIATYSSATNAYNAMAGIPIVGPALGVAAAAAAVLAGTANVKKILETNKENSATTSTGSSYDNVNMPDISTVNEAVNMVGVDPLLNEEADIVNMQNITINKPEEEDRQPQKIYVLEQDIAEVQNRVQVREQNSTF